ncbi:MAG: aldose 1-epimerase [Chloroflexi bacterium]|nr:aldose 1-epimerase [Chloroflexota bacterium]
MFAIDRYDVITIEDPVFHEQAFLLRDNLVGSSALVIPSLGNNLMSFVASLPSASRLEVILGAPAGTMREDAWRWGNPILFPFPNRVRHARYSFEGHLYHLDVNMPEGHHLHGLVCYRPWHVDGVRADDRGAVIRCSFNAEDHPDVLQQYPFPFLLTVAYILSGNSLLCEIEVRNVGSRPLPMGFGLHPYFRVPLAPDGSRDECLITIPAERVWQLDAEKLPTGQQVPVPQGLDFRKPRPLDKVYLDHSYTGLTRDAGQTTCRLIDPRARVEVIGEFGPEFPELVVLAPADRSTVSFEPYSCVTDAINLAAHRPDTGLVALRPGNRWHGKVKFSVASWDV